jgi:hypothetical protein
MKKLIVITAIFSLFSCKEHIAEETDGTAFYFDSPQPVNDSELSSLPSKFRGKYQINDAELTITDKNIYYSYLEDGKLAKSDLDSLKDVISYKGNKLVWTEGKRYIVYDVKDEQDSIYYFRTRLDTVFNFSDRQKAKRINGQLVLSTKDSIFWEVKMLSLEKDSLKWKYFSYKTDYELLKPIVKDIIINADTTVIHVKPSRREFSKILSLKTLSLNKYKKIK